jgi:hypothetical protein
MKRLALLSLVPVAVAVAFWVSACVFDKGKTPHDTTHNVIIRKDSIVIPGTEISKADHDAMNRILRRYDKTLYRIQTYENGQLKKTQGTLSDVFIDKTLASEIAMNVKKKGFAQDAMQIGFCSTPLKDPNCPTIKGTPAIASTPLKTDNVSKSQELVDRLKPILEKYSR